MKIVHLMWTFGVGGAEEMLADIVNELSAPHGRCRAAVMESCITAGVEGHVASSPAR